MYQIRYNYAENKYGLDLYGKMQPHIFNNEDNIVFVYGPGKRHFSSYV